MSNSSEEHEQLISYDRWDKRPYLQRAGDALSQLVNVWLLNGMTDESISGRCWRNVNKGQLKWKIVHPIIEFLFWPMNKGNHCRLAYIQDLERSKMRWVNVDNLTK